MDSIYSNSRGIHLSFIRINTGENIKISIIVFLVCIACHYCIVTERIRENNRIKLADLSANLTAAFEGNTDSMWVINYVTKELVFFNSAYKNSIEREYGKDVKIGLDIRKIISSDKIDIWNKFIYESIKNGKINEEYETVDGKYKEVTVYPITVENNFVNLVIFERDITEKKNFEKKIMELNNNLERNVEKRTMELERAYNDLESFSYTVSHELKTPIREIEAYIEVIEEDNGEILLPESKKDIILIKKICSDTINLIKQMMDYSKAGYVIMNLEYVDMNVLVKDCIDEISKSNNQNNVRIKIEKLPIVLGDRFLLKQVLFNIISNSYKFTRKIDNPIIEIWSEMNNSEYFIYFNDNGVGFNSNYSYKLFGVFDRLHDENEYEGKGIGLATVKKIMDRHGGEVKIIGKENEGCTTILKFKKEPL